MKVGSLVVCVKPYSGDRGVQGLVKGKIYTVRDIFMGVEKKLVIRLEDLINLRNPFTGNEYGYYPERFRELDTPTSISIEEILEEPVYA